LAGFTHTWIDYQDENMMNIIIALVLMQNVNTFDAKNNPSFDRLDKTIKVIRIINGVK